MKKFFDDFFNESSTLPLNPTNNFDPVALCVYPGIDTFLVRYILESITGIPTGSDLKEENPNINVKSLFLQLSPNPSSKLMRARGYKGEGVIDNTTWIKQTWFPHTPGQEFKASKCVIVVKSPFDFMWEKFEEKIKETKTTLGMNLIKDNEKLFNSFLASESEKLQIFYDYWLNVPVPSFILRIEDILANPERTLTLLFQFLLNLESLKGSQMENKILMFLKYNKTYEAFLNNYINSYESGVNNYSLLQKNITLKVMRNELIKLGYVNQKPGETFREEKGFDEYEMRAALEINEEEEKWLHEHNIVSIQDMIHDYKEKHKYCLITYLKVNSKKTKLSTDFDE